MELEESIRLLSEIGFRLERNGVIPLKEISALEYKRASKRNKQRYDFFIFPRRDLPKNEQAVFNFNFSSWNNEDFMIHDLIRLKDKDYLGIYFPNNQIYRSYTLFSRPSESNILSGLENTSKDFKLVNGLWVLV